MISFVLFKLDDKAKRNECSVSLSPLLSLSLSLSLSGLLDVTSKTSEFAFPRIRRWKNTSVFVFVSPISIGRCAIFA